MRSKGIGKGFVMVILGLRPPHDGKIRDAILRMVILQIPKIRKVVLRLAFNGKRAILDTNWV
jgi:hypothetical protein